MSIYLPAITAAILVCLGVSRAIPALQRPAMVVGVLLMAATAFAPDLAPGLRVLAAGLTAALAIYFGLGLRRGESHNTRHPTSNTGST